MQQPPPYQPPQYQQPPPGGFGAPGVQPTPMPSIDRLRQPMQLLVAAGGVAIFRSLFATSIGVYLRSSHDVSRYKIVSVTSPFQAILSLIVGGLFIAASSSIVSQKRPGHPLAMGAAIAAGIGMLFNFVSIFAGAFGGMGSIALLIPTLVGAGVLIAIALCLRQIGISRERRVDPLAFTLIGLASVGVLFAIGARLGVSLGEIARWVSLLIGLGEYGLLIAIALSIMSHVPAAEYAMGDPSAYRGPQGAYPMDASVPQGSMALGFMAGFFGGCIGLGLVLMIAKGPATKRGAGIGFAAQTVVGIILNVAAR